jgi:hypothetical protein
VRVEALSTEVAIVSWIEEADDFVWMIVNIVAFFAAMRDKFVEFIWTPAGPRFYKADAFAAIVAGFLRPVLIWHKMSPIVQPSP